MIKERLKGLLALVLAGATALTTTTAVSAADPKAASSVDWGGYVFLESDAIVDGVYTAQDKSVSHSISSDPAELAKIAGINDNFYEAKSYTIGWGHYESGRAFNKISYDDIIYFPYADYLSKEYSKDIPITNEMINGIGTDPCATETFNSARKMLVVNDVAKEFTIDYYDIFGNDTGKDFVFSDGKQLLDGKEIFGEGGENKKYILEYNDGDVEFTLNFSKDYDSAWELLTERWNTDYSDKTFDQSKLSLHREANFGVDGYYDSSNSEIIKLLNDRSDSTDLWRVKYGAVEKYIEGDKLASFLDEYNSSDYLRLYPKANIYLLESPDGGVNLGVAYNVTRKEVTKIPYDFSEEVTVKPYYELKWNLWSSLVSGGDQCYLNTKFLSDQTDALTLKDLNMVAEQDTDNDITIEYQVVPKVYSVNVQGETDKLNVTVVDKKFPTDGGDYLFTYGDSVSKVVKNGEELWTAITEVAADYDSTKANLTKVQPITSAAVSVDVPSIGGIPAGAEADSTIYTVTDTKWNPADSVFKANKEYTVTATLTPTLGYVFSADTTATVNGKKADVAFNAADGTLTVSYKFSATDKNTITSAEVTVTAPEEGKTPENTAELPADADYTVKSVSWNTDKEFTTGVKYTVTVVLAPGADHKFSADATATVNGKNADTNLNADGTLTVTYTFDKLKDDIDEELEKEHPVIKIPDGKPIPEDVIKKIKESGKEVEIDYGDYSWIIGPDFKPGFVPKPIDMSLRKVGEKDWATVVNNVTGHKYKMQIDIAYSGEFGFTAYLVLDLSEGMTNAPAGTYYANLYQITNDQLNWSGYSDLVNENGKWVAKLKFTHASDWLITIDSEINPGGNSDDSGSSSSSVIGSHTQSARTIKSVGWTKITEEIKKSDTGSTIKITLNDETTMPADALQAAIDKGVKLVMDAGFGRTWTIDGKNAVPGKYIDLSISGVNVGIPEAAYENILCSDSRQLKLNARLLNFTAQLTAFIGYDNIGQNAALYSYNEETGKLVFQDISVVDKNANVIFDIKCGGRYFIALGSEVTAPYYLCGDVNGDGVVNAIDAAAILKNAVYGYPLDKRCGDTNADGEVNAHDALPILHYVVGDVEILPVKD